MICVTILPRRNTLTSRQTAWHHVTPRARHIIPSIFLPHGLLLVVHCMVVCLTGIKCLYVLVVQRSLTVLRPSQAFHDIMCECRILLSDTQLPKLSVNHSMGRTRSWLFPVFHSKILFYKKLKNVSGEYDRLNGWNSTSRAAWYIRHVRIIPGMVFVN